MILWGKWDREKKWVFCGIYFFRSCSLVLSVIKRDYIKNLNPAQREAVTYGDGPLLVFAGAGSGKTRVLTRRIAHLIHEYKVHPSRIFAVTFTNKAAGEMKGRVEELLSLNVSRLWVSTFHAAGARILRRHAKELGYTERFAIYDSSDSLSALKRVYKDLRITKDDIDYRISLSIIDKAKNSYKSVEEVIEEHSEMPYSAFIGSIFEGYQNELLLSNAMDFGDLLCNVVNLFKLCPSILEHYKERFTHILVDEYQDTNRVQYLMLKMLAPDKDSNISVVGDDDQSIYAFRGANIENILNFKKDYPEAKVVTLSTNYRSTKNILEAANAVISCNQHRQKTRMITDNAVGAFITMHQGFTEREEAEFIVQEIAFYLDRGFRLSDMSVFYRTNAQSRAIEEALCEAGIAYEIFGGFRFYDRKEIKDILSYLKILLNPKDNESFVRIVNSPSRGIGAVTVGKLQTYAYSLKKAMFPALEDAVKRDAPILKGVSGKKLISFYQLMDDLRNSFLKMQKKIEENEAQDFHSSYLLSDFLKEIANKSNYISSLKKEDSLESNSRLENIHELFGVADDFSNRAISESKKIEISDFLDRTSLSSSLDKDEGKKDENKPKDTLSLMTLHLAKGLEYKLVFISGLEEGILPHSRSIHDPQELEEERRLFYVGITRAREKLYLTRSLTRSGFRGYNSYEGEPSRFIRNIPKNVTESKAEYAFDL